MSTQMIIRLDPTLKNRVNQFAKAEGKTTSEVVRELLENYIQSRDSSLYIDDLWERIGTKLTTKGKRHKDISKIIKERRGHH